jgi:putative ABC transport system ATP-binding protein
MTAGTQTSSVHRLSAVNVSVSIGPRRLLSEVDLSVSAGETLGVTGLSGSGKTTLLHVLAGLLPPDSGYVAVDGRTCSPIRAHRVGVVLQTLGLVPTLTADETVALPQQAAGLGRPEIASLVQPVLKRLGLEPVADHLVGDLSGGQRQRVAIARALTGDPDILLVDEPGAALDETWRDVVLALLADQATRGAIVVIASHDDDVIRACDRAVALEDGRLIDGAGSPGRVDPADRPG